MIAKISSSANLAGALGYNSPKVNVGGTSVLLGESLYENPDSAYTLLGGLSDMQVLGYESRPYIVFKNHDIEREHIHIVSLYVNSAGEKINDKFENRRSKRITDHLRPLHGISKAYRVAVSLYITDI